MIKKRKYPFQNLGREGWLKLGLAAIFAFYAVQIGMALFQHNLFVSLGADYRSFWSVGQIANTKGYANIYNLELQAQIQEPLVSKSEDPAGTFTLFPTVFLPVFIIPFQILAPLGAAPSFWIWTVLNIAGLILYLFFFTRDMLDKLIPINLVVMIMLSFAVFQNFFWGQVETWLVVCIGEFMRNTMRGNYFRSGLWLGGILIKPQALVLLVPFLLIQRAWKSLAGFSTMTFCIVLASIGLNGFEGINRVVGLWVGFASGLQSNAPENMMNWRMLGLHLSAFTSPGIGWGIAITGMLVTLLIATSLWLKSVPPSSPLFAVTLLGTLAATGAVTWHAHIHMAMVLIPPLVFLSLQEQLPKNMLLLWTILLPITMFIALVIGVMMQMEIMPLIGGIGGFMLGSCGLVLNLYILTWSAKTIRNKR
jgi:hypothetical protein